MTARTGRCFKNMPHGIDYKHDAESILNKFVVKPVRAVLIK